MFKRLSRTIVNKAMQNGIIEPEYIDENIYGLNAFLTITVNILTAAVIGIVFHMLWETATFIFVFKSLRKYVGGSHEDTAIKCYISSCILYVLILIAIKYYPLSGLITTIVMFVSSVILFCLSPVEAPNKPLDDIEKKVFKFRGRISVIIVLCIFMALHYIPNEYIYYVSVIIAVSVIAVTVFAIEGKLKLKYAKQK